ncbi:MAG: esterase family protein [Chloroflexota bacterium]|nr:esterase family protein [Chloroflexota bacterium]
MPPRIANQTQPRPNDLPDRKSLDARATHVTISSSILGIEKSFYVALPADYDEPQNALVRYPAIYLFRGHEHEWIHKWQDKSRRGRTVIDVYNALLEEGKVGPMILVFPGISSDTNRVPGFLIDFKSPDLVKEEPGIGTGCFESYFLKELIPEVDRRYRTLAERAGRAVDGFSLGGFQSIKIAAQRPDLFCSAGAFDGTFLYALDRGKSIRRTDKVLSNPIFAPAFGVPRDYEYAAANSPANLLWRADKAAISQVQWLIRSGPEAAEPWHSNYFRAQHVAGILKQRGIDNGIDPVLTGATHSWHWADKHMEGTLPLHWKAIVATASRSWGIEPGREPSDSAE